jgi:hypothetical protein
VIDKEDLHLIISEIFEEQVELHAQSHKAHHDWIQGRIEAEKERADYYREAKKTVIGWSIATLASAGIYFLQSHWKS